jgi:nucleoid-associated protein YgaU
MSTPNPFVPAGSLIAERQRRNRTQFKVAVYAVLAAHAMLVLGLLIQGCRSDSPASGASGPEATGPAASGANPAPAVQSQPQANERASRAAAAAGPALNRQHASSSIPATGQGGLIYVVKSGDTVARIAKAHGTTAQALRAANSLRNDRLVVGMKLKVPPAPG